MRIIKQIATVGNEEQNADCVVTIKPNDKGIIIEVESIVEKQYGDQIRESVLSELKRFDVENAYVCINDRGAIDPVLKARVEVAIMRASAC